MLSRLNCFRPNKKVTPKDPPEKNPVVSFLKEELADSNKQIKADVLANREHKLRKGVRFKHALDRTKERHDYLVKPLHSIDLDVYVLAATIERELFLNECDHTPRALR